MRWPFNKYQTFFLIFYFFLIPAFIQSQWSVYDDCAAPIQIFTIAALIAFFLISNTFILLKAWDLPNWARKFLTSLLHFILIPSCIYFPIQGIIWQVINMVETPNCPAVSGNLMSFIWSWIFCMSLAGFTLGRLSFLTLRNWWRIRRFRNQMRGLNQLASEGDLNAVNALLLENGDVNNRVGLLPSEIEKLETKDFSRNLMDMIKGSQEETCPICFEDYKAGDKTVCLPKCQHTFHSECVTRWLTKNPLCPMCRGNVRNGLYDRAPQNQDIENPAN